MLIYAALLLLITVSVAVIALYYYFVIMKKSKKKKSMLLSRLTDRLSEASSQLAVASANAGLSFVDILAGAKIDPNANYSDIERYTAKDETDLVTNGTCLIDSGPGLSCPDPFLVDQTGKTDCCLPPPGRVVPMSEIMGGVISTVIRDIAISVGVEYAIGKILMNTILKETAEELAEKAGEKAAKQAAKQAGKQSAKIFAKAGVKLARMGSKLTSLAKLAAGPIGWAWLAWEIVGTILDIVDVGGYNLFTANSLNVLSRNALEFAMQNLCKSENIDYPMMFTLGQVFEKEFTDVNALYMEEIIPRAMELMLADPKGIDAFIELLTSSFDETVEMSEESSELLGEFMEKVAAENLTKRDNFYYDNLLELLPNDKKSYIQKYPHMSTEKTIGVSLSEEGCNWWNDQHKQTWFENTSVLDRGRPPPKDYLPPLAAVFTQYYGVLDEKDPGTEEQPNMVEKELTAPAPLCLPMGVMFAYCEKSRTHKNAVVAVTPSDFGVKFDPSTRVCKYTKNYCDRFGMKYIDANGSTDCELYEGQYIAELIFGTILTRGVIKLFNEGIGGIKYSHHECTDDEIRMVFKNPDMRCVEFTVKDQKYKKYDGQFINHLCKDASVSVCIPKGGRASVKGTTYMNGKKLKSGGLSYDAIKGSKQYQEGQYIKMRHKPNDNYGSFYPTTKDGRHNEFKCWADRCDSGGGDEYLFIDSK